MNRGSENPGWSEFVMLMGLAARALATHRWSMGRLGLTPDTLADADGCTRARTEPAVTNSHADARPRPNLPGSRSVARSPMTDEVRRSVLGRRQDWLQSDRRRELEWLRSSLSQTSVRSLLSGILLIGSLDPMHGRSCPRIPCPLRVPGMRLRRAPHDRRVGRAGSDWRNQVVST